MKAIVLSTHNLNKKASGELAATLNSLRAMGPRGIREWRKVINQKNLKIFAVYPQRSDTIAGMAILRWHDLPGARAGFVDDVIVGEKYRGMGLGLALVNKIIAFAKSHKITYIDLTSSSRRRAAISLYKKLGWQKKPTNLYRLKITR